MSTRAQWYAVVIAGVVFAGLALWVGPVPSQDAFVTYDYARHLSAGEGFVYSPGDAPSEGYSSLLWLLLCAAMSAMGLDVPVVAPYLSLFFGVVCVVVLWDVFRRRFAQFWLASLLLFATAAPFVIAAMTGGEATLFALLLVGWAVAIERLSSRPSPGRLVLFGLLTTLCLLCRFEALVAAVVAGIVLSRGLADGDHARRTRLAALAILAGVVVVYHGWRVATFGAFLPSSLLVRLGVNTAVFSPLAPFDVFPFGLYYLIVAALSLIGFAASDRRAGDRFALVVALALGVGYLFVTDPIPGLPNHGALLVLAAMLWPHVHRAVMERGDDTDARSMRVGNAALVATLLLLTIGHVADNRRTVEYMVESQTISRVPLGKWLADWRPHLTLATDDPGAVEYYAAGTTLDLRRRSRIGSEQSNRVRALAAAKPDVVLLGADGIFGSRYDPGDAPFAAFIRQNYRVLAALRAAWSHDRVILVHVRRDIPELTAEQLSGFPQGVSSVLRLNR